MIQWKAIIIHHSATNDKNDRADWDAVRKFHTSWRIGGQIISPESGMSLLEAGHPVTKPWRDIGYHFGAEMISGYPAIQTGRSLDTVGAHCIGMNGKAIGVCAIGNFDIAPPTNGIMDATAEICAMIIQNYTDIGINNIHPHNEFASKTCPGRYFNMEELKRLVEIKLAA